MIRNGLLDQPLDVCLRASIDSDDIHTLHAVGGNHGCAFRPKQVSRRFANAGISGGMAGLFEQSSTDWEEILRVNLIGPFLAIKYAAPHMKERGGGSIVCTASVAGIRSGAGGVAYSASKAGVINLVKTAAAQLCDSNIRVNAICPGLIETGMTQGIYDMARAAGKQEMIGQLNPLRRGGEPSEIAQVALFLASDESSYVNGHALVADGGLSISHPFVRQAYGCTF